MICCPKCKVGKMRVVKTLKLTKERVRIRECSNPDCKHRVETRQPLEMLSVDASATI